MSYNVNTNIQIQRSGDIMNKLGDYLKELRGKKSLRDVQKATGISHTYLSTLEKGFDPRTKKERKPTVDILKKLADHYKIDYYKLLVMAGYIDEQTASFFSLQSELLETKSELYSTQKELENTSELYSVQGKLEKTLNLRKIIAEDCLYWDEYCFSMKERQKIVNFIVDNILLETKPKIDPYERHKKDKEE